MDDSTSTLMTCVQGLKTKYKLQNKTDKNTFMGEVLRELEKKPGCKVTAALMKMAAKEKYQ